MIIVFFLVGCQFPNVFCWYAGGFQGWFATTMPVYFKCPRFQQCWVECLRPKEESRANLVYLYCQAEQLATNSLLMGKSVESMAASLPTEFFVKQTWWSPEQVNKSTLNLAAATQSGFWSPHNQHMEWKVKPRKESEVTNEELWKILIGVPCEWSTLHCALWQIMLTHGTFRGHPESHNFLDNNL